MKKFNVKPLGAIISSLVMAAATQSVYAQEADAGAKDEPVVEEITVTGFAKSIQTAIEVKRKADTVVQAISAEDIGGLPDKSIADSLSRLPGVSVTRSSGQAGTIQVRGMGEGFVFSTINGREQVSPNGTRAMEFSQFPSELISSVEVYMSPKASLIEGGVAGTVELKTANALKMKEEQKFQVGVRGNFNDKAEELYGVDPNGKRYSFSFQKKLLDDTLGVSLGYAKLLQPNAATRIENDNYKTTQGNIDGKPVWVPESFFLNQKGGLDDRDGYMAAINFEPNEHLALEADLFNSKFNSQSETRGIRVQGFENLNGYNGTLFQNHYATGATFVGKPGSESIDFKVENNNESTDNNLSSYGFNAKWTQDSWSVAGDLSHSDADGRFENNLTRAYLYTKGVVDQAHPDGWHRSDDQQVTIGLNGISLPNFELSRNYTDLTSLRLGLYEEYPYINKDKIDAARVDGKYEFDDVPYIQSVEVGIRHAERNHKQSRQVFVYGDGSGNSIKTDLSLAITPDNSDVVNWKGDFAGYPSFLAVDGKTIIEQAEAAGLVQMSPYKFISSGDYSTTPNPDAYYANGTLRPRAIEAAARWGEGRSWSMEQQSDIQENVTTAYIMANLSTEVFDRELTGNIGLRQVETDQSTRQFVNVGGDVSKGAVTICDGVGDCRSDLAIKHIGKKYGNTLPSLNLNYHVTDTDQVRFALARVLSRAPLDKLSNSNQGSINISDPEHPKFDYGSSSSPLLTPFIADQVDVSFEHYMEETNGSFSIAAYNRNIKSFIQDSSADNFDFTKIGIQLPETVQVTVNNQVVTRALENGKYTFAVNNGSGGYIRGLELSYTQTFNFLPTYWQGLGFSGSLSKVQSAISVSNPFNPEDKNARLPFPGLVEESGNLTVFYSYEGFETRLSTTYQGSFVGEALNIDRKPVIYAAETVLDYQAKYKFENGVDVLFSIGNLTNEPNRSYMLAEDLPRRLNWFGRTYTLGANYTF